MFLCVRIDLDYVPWDAVFVEEFGHGEPAMVLRLLDFARASGLKFHFFASARVLRAFPAAADAVLGEGHDLDWLCTDPSGRSQEAAIEEFRLIGHKPIGIGIESPWPAWIESFQFVSCTCAPAGDVLCFATSSPNDVEAIRSPAGLRAWSDSAKSAIGSEKGSTGVTLALHPGIQGRFDGKLHHLREVCEFAESVRAPVITLRDAMKR